MLFRRAFYVATLLLIICTGIALAQCPVNIGFENGDFTNWTGYTGYYPNDNAVFTSEGIVPGVHSIISRASQQTDPYGHFALVSPNGSAYIAKLGNDSSPNVSGNGKAQKLTYTFKVPEDNNEFSLIYYYAVVIEDPVATSTGTQHTEHNKPKFTAAIFDVAANKYTDCANFNFVAISTLPGFVKAPTQVRNDVFYKDWSPVTIDLRGYAGKTLRLEFTTNNCQPTLHFAYAYIDINQNCNSPVSGNVICPSKTGITLTAPAGFQEYHWYKEKDYSVELANTNTYTVPNPVIGAGYSVRIVPFPNLGCPDTIYTTIKDAESFTLNIQSELNVCKNTVVDLTADNIHAGSSPGFSYYRYFATDPNLADAQDIPDPAHVTTAGKYYISAYTPSGCAYTKAIQINYLITTELVITNPSPPCLPDVVDLSAAYVTAGSINSGDLSYWKDVLATVALPNYTAVDVAGTYYIKSQLPGNPCFDIKPVVVTFNNKPVLVTNSPVIGCNTADLTAAAVTKGSSSDITAYKYYDPNGNELTATKASALTVSGTYSITAYNASCNINNTVEVRVSPYPQSTVTNPAPVIFPTTVDITNTYTTETNTDYFYYKDTSAIHVVNNPTQIDRSGNYFIKAVNKSTGCSKTFRVTVTVNPPLDPDYSVNTFTPNGDGRNDYFRIITSNTGVKLNYLKIYNSYGALLFETTVADKQWDGTSNGKKLAVGTYYWVLDGYDAYLNKKITKSGSITIVL